MSNIKFCYLYRDYANYKNHNELIFLNPNNTALVEINTIICAHLIDGEWFYAGRWNVNDLHFEKWDEEVDHSLHEFESVEYTDESPTEMVTIDEFIKCITSAKRGYII